MIKALIFDNFGVLMDLVYSSLRHILPDDARAKLLDILDQADSGRISDADELKQIEDLLNQYNIDGASAVEKIAKPDPRIYRLTCERLGVQPNECVFTDDNEANVIAARQVGMQGIVFTGNDDYFAKLREILGDA